MGFEIQRSENGRRKILISHFGVTDEKPSYKGKELLGGKGEGLRRLSQAGVPVPPGFTLLTTLSTEYKRKPKTVLSQVKPQIRRGMRSLRKELGFMPLVSVRSGAQRSMPGMLDTVLNVGLTKGTMTSWGKRIGTRPMLDCRRRLIQMFGNVVCGIDSDKFESILTTQRKIAGVEHDSELSVDALQVLCTKFEELYETETNSPFPETVEEQLVRSVEAVFSSWDNERAVHYRKMHSIPNDWGTAVNIVAMVFGNAGDTSGTGVMFTRNPATGENEIVGEYLQNAQGEDVVAGIRTPLPLAKMADADGPWPGILGQLTHLCNELETMYGDVQDIEFTVEKGKLWVLQTRSAQRTATAAFKTAVDMFDEGLISKPQALGRVTPKQFAELAKPGIDPTFEKPADFQGLPACPGIVSGFVATSAEQAIKMVEDVVLVAAETCPDDLAGMEAAVGVLTAHGGVTSHAAVVARGMNTAVVVGAGDEMLIAANDAKRVTIDGGTGRVWFDTDVPVVGGSLPEAAQSMVEWAYEITGAVVRGSEVISKQQRVTATAWVNDRKQMMRGLEFISKMQDASGVVLDLSQPMNVRLEEDEILWSVFGETDEKQDDSDLKAVIEEIASTTRPGVVVFLPESLSEYASKLKAAGCKIARTVRKLDDLFEADGYVNIGKEFIQDVCGSDAAYAELMKLIAKSGKKCKPVPVGQSVNEVVGAVFGKE